MPVDAPRVLSAGQKRLWFLQELFPENPFYNYADLFRIRGPLDQTALFSAVRSLVLKHSSLRTTFEIVDGQPFQKIQSNAEFQSEVFDISHLDAQRREQQAVEIAMREASAPFDLSTGPLLRVTLIILGPDHHLLAFTTHHIIIDKWSMRVVRKDLAEFYQKHINGEDVTPQIPKLQYVDFAHWQQTQNWNNADLDFWKNQLAGEIPVLDLPVDYQRKGRPTFGGGFVNQTLPPELSKEIMALCKAQNVTGFAFLLAAFKILLHKYSGQQDILVGSPFTDRDRVELEEMIGFFNNTLVLRSVISGNASALDFLQQVKQTTTETFAFKHVQFEALVQELKPDRNLELNPFFRTMFLYHDVPPKPTFGSGITWEYEPFDIGVAKFDLTLYVSHEEGQLTTIFEYASDLFERSTIERMQQHLLILLQSIVANPHTRISELSILSESELQQIIYQWNDTRISEQEEQNIIDAFAHSTKLFPDRTAVVAEKELTYAELHARAQQVALALIRQGLSPNSIVGLCVERSVEMAVGILGILQAGAAYLPLDPSYPNERLSYMIQDSGASLVLMQSDLAPTHPFENATTLTFEECADIPLTESKSIDNPSGDDLAYLIYTSGSMGRPKGVPISHANLMHSTQARLSYYPENPAAFLLLSSFAFDSSVAGIFWTLSTGGKLVIPPRRIEQDIDLLADWIETQGITTTLLLPSLYQMILEHASPSKLKTLKDVIVAGEACGANLGELHFERLPEARLHNEYGPTEASVWCTVYEIHAEKERPQIPIGRPIENTEIFILDSTFNPVPIGVAGELYIGGKGLASGYWRREELTATQFPKVAIWPDQKKRLYRTGDLARYRADGNIEFLGRADRQIKIRGFRVELGEIKEAIERFPTVSEVAVVVQKNAQGRGDKIAAFFVGKETDRDVLRAFLRKQLPDYMVPATLHALDELPRLPNGKVDHSALSDISVDEQTARDFAAPRTGLEKDLAGIWEHVLGITRVGIHDNFFEVGGDSILSIRIIAQARRNGIYLKPNQIFEHQTIAELALFAKKDEVHHAEDISGDVRLTPIQLWFFEEHKNAPHHWNQALKFDVPQALTQENIQLILAVLLRQHDTLRLHFRRSNEVWESWIDHEPGPTRIWSIDCAEFNGEAAEHKILEELSRIQSGMTLQSDLFQVVRVLFPKKQQIIFVAHHLIIDAVSWGIVIEDFNRLVEQSLQGEALTLDSKTTAYPTWSNFLYSQMELGIFDSELKFWRDQVNKAPLLPTDYQGALPILEKDIRVQVEFLDSAESQQVREATAAYHLRIDELMCAALCLTLQSWTQNHQCHLSLEKHGRDFGAEQIDVSGTVGWFTSFYPRIISVQEQNPGLLLKSIKEQLRAVPNGGVGYGVLRFLKGIAELSHQHPIVFNYLGDISFGGTEMISFGARSPESERTYLIEINVLLRNNILEAHWSYPVTFFKDQSIQELAKNFYNNLKILTDYCLTSDESGFTPSDFPEAGLDQEDLDNLLGQMNFE